VTFASAMPEKRLFVSLITRDITLSDAILDLIDNSINAAMSKVSSPLDSAEAFYSFLGDTTRKIETKIRINISDSQIEVVDDAGGIDAETAQTGIFHFGTAAGAHSTKDRLSVFGIGMKRAMFKLGNSISMTSEHPSGGFSLKLNVREWEETPQQQWGFEIEKLKKYEGSSPGTSIRVTELHDEVRRRILDPTFIPALKDKVAKTYAYYLGRLAKIFINEESTEPIVFEIGGNFAHDNFRIDNVEYNITAGIAPQSEHSRHTHEAAGWFVFCNGRALLYADKSEVTGWGGGILPVFQPKHRPFIGLVFFYSAFPEELPWTTTKDFLNQESAVWQEAKQNMAALARPIVSVLDQRYNDSEPDSKDMARLAGETTNSLSATISVPRTFSAPEKKTKKMRTTTRIQYDVLLSELQAIKKHLGQSNIAGSAVGRLTFDYYLENEVGTK